MLAVVEFLAKQRQVSSVAGLPADLSGLSVLTEFVIDNGADDLLRECPKRGDDSLFMCSMRDVIHNGLIHPSHAKSFGEMLRASGYANDAVAVVNGVAVDEIGDEWDVDQPPDKYNALMNKRIENIMTQMFLLLADNEVSIASILRQAIAIVSTPPRALHAPQNINNTIRAANAIACILWTGCLSREYEFEHVKLILQECALMFPEWATRMNIHFDAHLPPNHMHVTNHARLTINNLDRDTGTVGACKVCEEECDSMTKCCAQPMCGSCIMNWSTRWFMFRCSNCRKMLGIVTHAAHH